METPDTYDAYQEREDFARLCDYLFEDRVYRGSVAAVEMAEIQARFFVTPRKPERRPAQLELGKEIRRVA